MCIELSVIQAAQFPLSASGMQPFYLARAKSRQLSHGTSRGNRLTNLSENKMKWYFISQVAHKNRA